MSDNSEMISCEQILHDIKTPLSLMYNSIREIERASGSVLEIKEPLEVLKRNWLRIIKLITDASDYQKLSLGLMPPKLANYDVVSLVRNITESTRALASRKGIELVFETDKTEKRMAVDKDIMDRILLNLLSNAIKFTDTGGEIRVLLGESNGELVITVSDNGIGISAENTRRIFEPHYFVQNPKNPSGTGMGLFIVKQLCGLLAGDIRAERRPKGTSMTVRLPCFLLESGEPEAKYFDDFYSDNMVQIELSNVHGI